MGITAGSKPTPAQRAAALQRQQSAAVLDRLRLMRRDPPDKDKHELRVKNIQLRHDRRQAERAANVRNELNTLAAHYRRVMPNAVAKTIKRQVSRDFLRTHGHLPQQGL